MGSRGTSDRRGAPARVFFFPKREGRRGTPFEFASPVLRTLPELALPHGVLGGEAEAEPEPVTEPLFVSPFAEVSEPRARRPSARARRTVEAPVERSPYAGLSRRELAQVSVFGHGLFEAGRIDEARQIFEQLVAAGAQDAFPHTMLGTIYLAQKSPDRALALFESALAIDPHDLAARVYRGEIRLQRGEVKQAIADLEWARSEGPRGDPFTERARRLLKTANEARRRRR